MKILTKELKNDLDLNEVRFSVDSRAKRTLPIFFLNDSCEGVYKSDILTVKTKFNLSDKENELRFMILPATFNFYNDYCEYSLEKETHSPENDFLSQYINRLRVISHLPQEILEQVKDKRLLAMGYAEPKVKKAIIEYADAKTEAAIKVLEKSLEDSLNATAGLTISEQFKKHDYIDSLEDLFSETYITEVDKKGNAIYLELDGEETIILTDVEILEEEINPLNTYIELFELHKTEQDYELHFLLMTKEDNTMVEEFHYLTYRFKDLMFK